MDIVIPLHTIIMFIGTVGCGKTTFARQILLPALVASDPLRGVTIETAYLSDSDISENTIYTQLDELTSFPINAEFVVIDTLGLDAGHRESVRVIAQKNAYKVITIVFDYANRTDYYVDPALKETALDQIKLLQHAVLPNLKHEQYAQIIRLKKKNFLTDKFAYRIQIKNLALYMSCHLPLIENNIFIGDIHECLDEFQTLLQKLGATITNGKLQLDQMPAHTKFVLLGDYVDKGHDTKAIINFIYANRAHFHILVGNHENFSYKFIHGLIDPYTLDMQKINTYFTSIPPLQKDSALQTKFETLFSEALPFAKKIGSSLRETIYATHAPSQQKYLGKLHANARRNQRNFRLNRTILQDPQLAYIVAEANPTHPRHLFGHVMTKEYVCYYNKIAMDTGVVAGNKLTAVQFVDGEPIFTTVAALPSRIIDPLPQLFTTYIPDRMQD